MPPAVQSQKELCTLALQGRLTAGTFVSCCTPQAAPWQRITVVTWMDCWSEVGRSDGWAFGCYDDSGLLQVGRPLIFLVAPESTDRGNSKQECAGDQKT